MSTAVKEMTEPLVLIVAPELLREIREGYERLETRDGRPLLQVRSFALAAPATELTAATLGTRDSCGAAGSGFGAGELRKIPGGASSG